MAFEKPTQFLEGDLIKAARSLDQSSADSIPDTLSNLWLLLSNSIAGNFHASEELILRWLLKNMNGSAEVAEQFRRYPMAWSIMTCVFQRMPLFSLAKSLADRRFMPILQLTLKEISKPQSETLMSTEASSDVEMVDAENSSSERISRKRKRSFEDDLELGRLRSAKGCLRTAETLFNALHSLLARLEKVEADVPTHVLMGAEHAKSLFCSPAEDALEILRPILAICDLALNEQEPEFVENQASWVAIFASLWNLHLQSSNDASEVAMSLYPTGCIIMAKLERSRNLVMDPHVKATWTRDLRRFFTKNMILPARAAFLNRKDIGIIQAAVDVTNFMPTASCPIIFSLAVKAPRSTDDASARKDHEDWTQKVFEVIEEPVRAAEPAKRNQATKIVLDTALESKASVSLGSLRTVCRQHTTESGNMDLNLVSRAADLDVDAFLISKEGHDLLDDILKQVVNTKDTDFKSLAEADPVKFIVTLAKGFARGRDLPGFMKKWLNILAECLAEGEDHSSIKEVLSSKEVTVAVSSLLQSSVNTRQLLSLLDWLEAHEASAKTGALLVVLEAISQGIEEEDFIDAVNIRLFEMISKIKIKSLDGPMRARWWRIVEDTVSRSTSDAVASIWTRVESDLKKALKKGELADAATLAAFRCCSRFWLANYPGGSHESEASTMTYAFLKRLAKGGQQASTSDGANEFDHFASSRLVDLLAKSNPDSNIFQSLLSLTDKMDSTNNSVYSLLSSEVNLSNYKYINGLISHATNMLAHEQDNKSAWDTHRINAAITILLEIPSEALTREQRQGIMSQALYFVSKLQSQKAVEKPNMLMTSLLSLMVKIMKRPTFYEGMKFSDLVTVGESLVAIIQADVDETDGGPGVSSAYAILKLFEVLASVTLKQMTSNLDKRERTYLADASSIVSAWPSQVTEVEVHLHILLRSLILSLESSKAKQQTQDVADPAAMRVQLSLMLSSCLTAEIMSGVSNDDSWLQKRLPTCFTLVVIEQLDIVEPAIIRDRLRASRASLERLSNILCSHGARAGWRLQELLFTCFQEETRAPLLTFTADDVLIRPKNDDTLPIELLAGAGDINRYIDVVLKGTDEGTRNRYLGATSERLHEDRGLTGYMLAIHRLVRGESDSSLRSTQDVVELAAVHGVLTNELAKSKSSAEFVLLSRTIHMLLDKKASVMKQWNTEVTLSAVSIICAGGPDIVDEVKASPKTYEWLCRLVEIILKRHRLRLEGHFHLLMTTLKSVLHLLIVPYSNNPSFSSHDTTSHLPLREKQAKLFSRLLTLVCEPSVASVTRGQPIGLLDSATETAKRSAGQHMYLVLMQYIKLQLEHPIPRIVREALQPGMDSILNITSQEGRRILNEAVDGSGRAIFREMYRRYVKFGKWTGV